MYVSGPKYVLLQSDPVQDFEISSNLSQRADPTVLRALQVNSTAAKPVQFNPPAYSIHPSSPHLPQNNFTLSTSPQTIASMGIDNPTSFPVTTQPASSHADTRIPITHQPRHWKSGIFDCCASACVCFCVCLCPFCYGCAMAKKLGENGCLSCCPGGIAIMRYKYRNTHHIEGSAMDDACLSALCRPCVLCQLGYELNAEKYPKKCCGCC